MFGRRSLTIKAKLILIIMSTSIAGLLLTAVLFSLWGRVMLRRTAVRDLSIQAEMIADNCKAALAFGDVKDAEETLSSLRNEHSVTRGCIYGKDGALFASYSRDGAGGEAGRFEARKDGAYFDSDSLRVCEGVILDGERIGTVCLRSDLEPVRAMQRLNIGIVVAVVLLAALVAYFVSSKLQGVISSPVLSLASLARDISEKKDYSVRAPKFSEDEVGVLGDSFNLMLEQIQARDKELLTANEELEQRVSERTAELSAANARLLREVAERERAEQQVRESEARFRELFNNMHSGVAVYEAVDGGADFVFKDLNKAGEGISQVRKEDIIGRRVTEVFPRVREFGLFEVFQRVWKTGKAESLPTSLYRDGRIEGWTENYVYKLPSGEVVAVYDDVTERVEAQRRIKRAAEEWRTTFDSIGDMVSVHSKDYKLMRVNKAFAEAFEKSPEELIGKTCYKLVHGSEEPCPQCPHRLTISTRKSQHVEFYEPHLGIYLEVSTSPIVDGDGEYVGSTHVVKNITARKQAEEARERENAKLGAMISGMEEGVVFADAEGGIIEVNEYFCRFVGKGRDEIIGSRIEELHEGLVLEHIKALISRFREHIDSKPFIMQRRIGDAEIMLRVQPIYRQGCYDGVLLNMVDVTDLVRARRKAEEATEAKAAFLANMSHEIRTPMNAIVGFSDILADMGLTEEQREYVGIIQESAQHLLAVVNDILDFSKVEAGKLKVELIDWPLGKLLDSIESLMGAKAAEKGIEFRIIEGEGLPVEIRTDPMRLRQCLINLVNNAIKFTQEGYVHLNVNPEQVDGKAYIRFDVEDSGVGIPADKQESVFEAFSQADGGTARKFGGTGLGLAITRQFAELLGGQISLQSEAGKGSVFSLKVPAGVDVSKGPSADSGKVAEKATAGEAESGQRMFSGRVLVAEDTKTNQVLIKLLLTKMGLEVTIAENGKEAVDKALREDFDLIFMDIQMPVMDGYEATRILRSKEKGVPIVALTASAIKGDDGKCFAAGCDDYMSKPINQKRLVEVLGKYLGSENGPVNERRCSGEQRGGEVEAVCVERTGNERQNGV